MIDAQRYYKNTKEHILNKFIITQNTNICISSDSNISKPPTIKRTLHIKIKSAKILKF